MPFEISREQSSHMMQHAIQSLEVGGAAFGFGWYQGKKGGQMPEVLGISADLGAGLLLHALGFVGDYYGGSLGSFSKHAHNLGDGSLASYLVNLGHNIGTKSAETAAQTQPATPTPVATAGLPWGMPSYQPYSPAFFNGMAYR